MTENFRNIKSLGRRMSRKMIWIIHSFFSARNSKFVRITWVSDYRSLTFTSKVGRDRRICSIYMIIRIIGVRITWVQLYKILRYLLFAWKNHILILYLKTISISCIKNLSKGPITGHRVVRDYWLFFHLDSFFVNGPFVLR